jgi:hypothetical protein
MNKIALNEQKFFLYKDKKGKINVNALLKNETIWLTQKSMAELFDVEVPAISKHIGRIYESGELQRNVSVSKMEIVQTEGNRQVIREVDFYNLDMIIAVGYRVNSPKATAFRIWATNVLHEYIIKGFVLDDERLKNGKHFGKDYFRELLERIKDIRTSERRLYQQLKDIYALSADYNDDKKETLLFFATVQNKVHYAITGQTSAEIIHSRADSSKKNMGLTTWKNAPDGNILKTDSPVAKNYLKEPELDELRYIVNAFLDYAERQAKHQELIFMKDWETQLEELLKFNKKAILQNAGKISKTQALKKAYDEYAKYKESLKIIEKSRSEQELIEDIKALDEIILEQV